MERSDWCLVSVRAAITLHDKKPGDGYAANTYDKKLRLNHRNGNRNIDIIRIILILL